MRRLLAGCIAVALLFAVANTSQAQFPGMGGDNAMTKLMILDSKDVRKDLKFSDEQTKKADALIEKMSKVFEDFMGGNIREKMQEFQKESDAFFKEGLKAEQTKRFDQIVLQQQGGQAFQNAKLKDELKLTDDQKKKFKDLDGDMRKSTQEIGFDFSKIQENMAKMQEVTKSYTERYVKVLDDEQKKKWNEKVGEPFKGKIEMDFSKFFRPRP